ncbi:teneurin-m [Caerostris extrusa]|uniref:Teneurin-m n=1 Tax=Caerostris extrusa TaxID=172846 RepID=A0AAV4PDN4_CAEEX|nr:teneurin-m [Caerostris extrusa]
MVTMQYMGNKIDIQHVTGDRIVSFGETPYVLDGRGFVIQRATDHTGSPLLVYDVYGDVVKEIHRGPYGHVLFDSNPNFYLPVDFQGGLLDPMTGLIHFGDRVYDSLVGQWMTPGLKNKLDLKEWIHYQGINLDTLDLAANQVYQRGSLLSNCADFEPLFIDLPTVPLISGLTCSVHQKLLRFAQLTSITVSNINGRAVVRASARAEIIRKDVFSAVFNNCHILDLHLTFHGLDVFYLVKDNTRRVGDDLNQLQRLGNSAVNTTVHESKQEEGEGLPPSSQPHQVDVRIHSHHAILNIRYGTSPEKERQRLLRHAKRQAVSKRWSQERDIISSNQRGPLKWSEREKEQILSTGLAAGYRGEYFHDVFLYPELADDPSNVYFHKSNDRHSKR